jgi:hypothetical protein
MHSRRLRPERSMKQFACGVWGGDRLDDLGGEDPVEAGGVLATAASLARHAGHGEIQAWVYETRAWQVLMDGDYPQAVDLSRAAQRLAPKGSSMAIQASKNESA